MENQDKQIIKMLKYNLDDVINECIKSRDKYNDILLQLNSEQIIETYDARRISNGFISMEFQNLFILLKLIRSHYYDLPEWKIDNQNKLVSHNGADILIGPLIDSLRLNLYTNAYIYFEHFIRLVGLSLGKNIRGGLYHLTCDIIDELKLDSTNKDLMSIVTFIRNTVHFSGIHTDRNDQIFYKEKKFIFEKGKNVHFDFESCFFLLNNIGDFMLTISQSEKIKNIRFIQHDAAKLTFVQAEE